MADFLTESVLPVLGLCPPGSLLLPWLQHARAATGAPLDLPARASAATLAVARRTPAEQSGSAPVAAFLLEQPDRRATLVLLDWGRELGPGSGAALRRANPRHIFGIDVPVARRYLLMLSQDEAVPLGYLHDALPRLELAPGELGWIGLRSLLLCLEAYLGRTSPDRFRAPERSAQGLITKLAQHGVRSLQQASPFAPDRARLPLPARWGYEPLRRGSREFPFCFAASEEVCDQALVLDARVLNRQALRRAASIDRSLDRPLGGM